MVESPLEAVRGSIRRSSPLKRSPEIQMAVRAFGESNQTQGNPQQRVDGQMESNRE